MKINLSIIGSGRIVEEHIKAALNNNINIKYIFSPRKNSKNAIKLSKKYKIINVVNFKKFLNLSENENSNFLIASRIKDNSIYLNECLKTKGKIFIEKPIFKNSKLFNKYMKYNERIFVGYNRIFYNNVNVVKKYISNEKNLSINCICPEVSKERIITNSSHLISILLYLTNDIKLIYREKAGNIIFTRFKAKNNCRININFHLKSLSNFGIEFISKNYFIKMSPLENIKIYNKIKKIRIKNNNLYKLTCTSKLDEYKVNDLKPVLKIQMNYFKKFCRNYKIKNDLKYAKKIISVCELIKQRTN